MFENPLINAFSIVVLFWLGSYVVTALLRIVEKITAKTGTDLDDKVIKAIKLPIRYLAILMGFFFAFRNFGWTWTMRDVDYGVADIFFILIVLLLSYTASRLLKTIFNWYSTTEAVEKVNQTMFIFLRKILSVSIYAIALMIILGQFDVQLAPLLAGLGVAGLAISLGLKDTLANLFGGVFLVLDKSVSIGDWIQLEDGTKAYIEDISWRTVRIRTIGGNTVIVPCNTFVNQQISSYDYPEKSFYTSIAVGVAYDTDLEKAEYVALQAAEKVIKDEEIREQENNPIVRYKELADSSINFSVIVKVDSVKDEGRVTHALIKQIVKDFKEASIEIPFPQRVVELKK